MKRPPDISAWLFLLVILLLVGLGGLWVWKSVGCVAPGAVKVEDKPTTTQSAGHNATETNQRGIGNCGISGNTIELGTLGTAILAAWLRSEHRHRKSKHDRDNIRGTVDDLVRERLQGGRTGE